MSDELLANGPTVREWIDAFDPDSVHCEKAAWERRRLERLHAVQVSLDVIAHAHNIPLRLLRLDNLKHLDKTFTDFVDKWKSQVLALMTEPTLDHTNRVPPLLDAAQAEALVERLRDPALATMLRDWVLKLAEPHCSLHEQELPAPLRDGYAEWFLMLLPHLERDIWLTEMSNPLPVHNLARMVEHWALFVLMWAWSRAEHIAAVLGRQPAGAPEVLPAALDVEHLGMIVLPGYRRQGRARALQTVLLVGPFVRPSAAPGDDDDDGGWFCEPFNRFLRRIARVRHVSGWDGIHEKAPDNSELADALQSRAAIEDDEAQRRASQSHHALSTLLEARLAPDLFHWPNGQNERPLSRANWESMAVLASWRARWGPLLEELTARDGRPLWVELPRHRVKLLVWRAASHGASGQRPLVFTAAPRASLDAGGQTAWLEVNAAIEMARRTSGSKWVEAPGNLHAKVRERQQAGWYAYISAINHLLARHTRSDRPEGADGPNGAAGADTACEEVDHLLRGFGGRVCRYLIGMARADLAEIYWLDYSGYPPRLRHVGGAERLVQHRADRQTIWRASGEALARELAQSPPGSEMDGGGFLAVRAIFSGQIVPLPGERKAASAQNTAGRPGARFDFYDRGVVPQDGIAVPLTFNGRVVGVLGLAGVASSRHFDTRLHPSLRILAQDLGIAMYFHSQVWQMRRINWLASNVQLELWQERDLRKPEHPMKAVAQCLANIFLCPGVHVWLRDPRRIDERYRLGGSTALDAFAVDGLLPEHAPSVTLPPVAPGTPAPLTRPTFAFALDRWLPLTGACANDPDVRALRGRFIQARIDERAAATQYDYPTAERGELVLGADFLASLGEAPPASNGPLPQLRDALYRQRKWTDLMAFALVNESGDQVRTVGVVSLHGPSQKQPDARSPWPPGWRTVVSHVQTYLPYVLTQTETIDKPLNQLVHYLLHQGRNELNATAVKAANTKRQLNALLALDAPLGHVRPWLRKRLKSKATSDDAELHRNLFQLDQLLAEAADGLDAQGNVEHAESLTMLSRLIERRRSVAALGHDLAAAGDVHRARWINVHTAISKALAEYRGDFKSQHIYWSTDQIPASLRLLSQPRLWGWLLSDITHNIAKYAAPNSAVEVALHDVLTDGRRTGHKLRFINEAEFDGDLDQPALLMRFGVQGSAGLRRQQRQVPQSKLSRNGTGIGLWGVNELAGTIGLQFSIEIRPFEKRPGYARYFFDLAIPNDLLRRDAAA